MEFGTVDGCDEMDDAGRLLARLGKIPSDYSEILRTAQEVPTAWRPGEVLHLADVSTEDTGKAVGFNIEKDNSSVNLADTFRDGAAGWRWGGNLLCQMLEGRPCD